MKKEKRDGRFPLRFALALMLCMAFSFVQPVKAQDMPASALPKAEKTVVKLEMTNPPEKSEFFYDTTSKVFLTKGLKLRAVFSDGSDLEAGYPASSTWAAAGINLRYAIETADTLQDVTNKEANLPVGDYLHVISVAKTDVQIKIPFSVIPLSKAPVLEDSYTATFAAGEILVYQLPVAKECVYELKSQGDLYYGTVYDENFEEYKQIKYADMYYLRLEKPGTYYLMLSPIYGSYVTEYTFTRLKEVESIEIVKYPINNIYYTYIGGDDSGTIVRVHYADGTYIDATWGENENGYVTWDDYASRVVRPGRTPATIDGKKYMQYWTCGYEEIKASLLLETRPDSEIPTIQPDEITEVTLEQEGKYAYFQMPILQAGVYQFITPDMDSEIVVKSNKILKSTPEEGARKVHTAETYDDIVLGKGVFYIRVKVKNTKNFRFLVMRSVPVQKIEVVDAPEHTELLYGVQAWEPSDIRLQVSFEEGDPQLVSMGSKEWNELDIQCKNETKEGGAVTPDDAGNLPVGEYRLVFYVPGFEDIIAVIPYTVKARTYVHFDAQGGSACETKHSYRE